MPATSRQTPTTRARQAGRISSVCGFGFCGFAGLAAAMALVAGMMTAPALAQDTGNEPPYERQLLRLSEIMGALHFLRPLCARPDEPAWRDQMDALLQAEAADEARKRRFIERFNQGYRGFASVYHSCTPAARDAMAGYIGEGAALVRDVTARYSR